MKMHKRLGFLASVEQTARQLLRRGTPSPVPTHGVGAGCHIRTQATPRRHLDRCGPQNGFGFPLGVPLHHRQRVPSQIQKPVWGMKCETCQMLKRHITSNQGFVKVRPLVSSPGSSSRLTMIYDWTLRKTSEIVSSQPSAGYPFQYVLPARLGILNWWT